MGCRQTKVRFQWCHVRYRASVPNDWLIQDTADAHLLRPVVRRVDVQKICTNTLAPYNDIQGQQLRIPYSAIGHEHHVRLARVHLNCYHVRSLLGGNVIYPPKLQYRWHEN
jgi:hypothetical protein